MSYRTGAAHHRAKLSTDEVKRARELRERNGMSFKRIGEVLNCSMWTVRDVCEYRTRVNS